MEICKVKVMPNYFGTAQDAGIEKRAMIINARSLDWILDDRYRWVQHLLFWVILYSPHILIFTGMTGNPPTGTAKLVYIAILALDIVMVYLNLYLFIPHLFLKKRFPEYVVASSLVILFNASVGPSMVEFFIEGGDFKMPLAQSIVNSTVMNFTITLAAAGLNIGKRFLRSQARLKELETTSLKTELEFLKNQINPHFLFNSLNNIYVQSRTNPTQASETILHLSDLLRYQLYDCAQERVNLHDEINYIQNYLNIDKIRKNNSQINFKVEGNSGGIKIAPFMFIPFVENAVKHSIGLENSAHINIDFKIKPEEILFSIENSKPPQPYMRNGTGGIGLANISRRLDLLYPGRYKLDIDNNRKQYRVQLALKPN